MKKDATTIVAKQTASMKSVSLRTLPEPQPHLCSCLLLKLNFGTGPAGEAIVHNVK